MPSSSKPAPSAMPEIVKSVEDDIPQHRVPNAQVKLVWQQRNWPNFPRMMNNILKDHILGSITVGWGLLMVWFPPDNPVVAKFLSQDERVLAVERMRAGQTGIASRKFKAYQVKEALLDVETWAFVVISFCVEFTNGAVSGFGPIIIHSFGFNHFKSVLMNGAVTSVCMVTTLISGFICAYFRDIIYQASWAECAHPLFRFPCLGFFVAPFVMRLAVMTSNTAGYTKRAFTTTIVWGAYYTTNDIAPLLFKTTEVGQHYPSTMISLVVLLSVSVMAMLGLCWYLQSCNKKRDQMGLADEFKANRTAFADLTDKDNPNFRYPW